MHHAGFDKWKRKSLPEGDIVVILATYFFRCKVVLEIRMNRDSRNRRRKNATCSGLKLPAVHLDSEFLY